MSREELKDLLYKESGGDGPGSGPRSSGLDGPATRMTERALSRAKVTKLAQKISPCRDGLPGVVCQIEFNAVQRPCRCPAVDDCTDRQLLRLKGAVQRQMDL